MIRTIVLEKYDRSAQAHGDAKPISVLRYEALNVQSDPGSINAWAYDMDGDHLFEDRRIPEMWAIYDDLDPDMKVINPGVDNAERFAFSKRSFHLGMAGAYVSGGAWVDQVVNGSGYANFHIVVCPIFRGQKLGMSDFLLECFEGDAKTRHPAIKCGFGPRKDCDPARFFKRHGYAVTGKWELGGYALKIFRPADATSLPASSSGTSSARL